VDTNPTQNDVKPDKIEPEIRYWIIRRLIFLFYFWRAFINSDIYYILYFICFSWNLNPRHSGETNSTIICNKSVVLFYLYYINLQKVKCWARLIALMSLSPAQYVLFHKLQSCWNRLLINRQEFTCIIFKSTIFLFQLRAFLGWTKKESDRPQSLSLLRDVD
jgi:hypothetical protein